MEGRIGVSGGRIALAILRGWWIVVLGGLVGGLLAFGVSSARTPVFQSTASLYFSLRTGSSGSDINQGAAYTQNQMLSFAQLATSSIVLDEVRADVADQYTVPQIRNMTTVSIPQNTVILDVTVGSTDARAAAQISNGIAANLLLAVDAVAPKDDAGVSTVGAEIIDPAEPATVQTSPNKQRDALLGALAGGALAAAGLAIWALLDTRVRSEQALRRATTLPLLGSVPRTKRRSRRPILDEQPNGRAAEAYRGLRASLRFSAVERDIRSILVTSSVPGEGKTTTSTNLALTYAEAGLKVLLVDADLRRPMVAETLGVENSVGLTTVLVGALKPEKAMLTWGSSALKVLPAGEVPPNPAELLASAKMAEVLKALGEDFDVVIVDAAPLLSVADATVLAQHVDTTIVVADARRAHISQLTRSIDALQGVGAQVAGVLLNRVTPRRRDSYNYYTSQTRRRGPRRLGNRFVTRAPKPATTAPAPD